MRMLREAWLLLLSNPGGHAQAKKAQRIGLGLNSCEPR